MFRIQHIPSGTPQITAREAGAAACLLVLGAPSKIIELFPHLCFVLIIFHSFRRFSLGAAGYSQIQIMPNSLLLHAFLFWLFPPMVDLYVVC